MRNCDVACQQTGARAVNFNFANGEGPPSQDLVPFISIEYTPPGVPKPTSQA